MGMEEEVITIVIGINVRGSTSPGKTPPSPALIVHINPTSPLT